jgi:hypothetical protein
MGRKLFSGEDGVFLEATVETMNGIFQALKSTFKFAVSLLKQCSGYSF